jgi:hypothetical protein
MEVWADAFSRLIPYEGLLFMPFFSSQHPMLSSIDAFVAHGNSTHLSKYLKQQKEIN